jgi:hypothetical protein
MKKIALVMVLLLDCHYCIVLGLQYIQFAPENWKLAKLPEVPITLKS